MHLTDHISDVQLNEYLDNASSEHASIESHLDSCDECAARLFALQTLFTELDSLPEVELTRNIAARFTPTPSLPAQLPRWLTLTATLQATVALIAIIAAMPLISNLMPIVEIPSMTETLIQVQSQWMMWLDKLTHYQIPSLPQLPLLEFSNLSLALTVTGISLVWLIGNSLLLRKRI